MDRTCSMCESRGDVDDLGSDGGAAGVGVAGAGEGAGGAGEVVGDGGAGQPGRVGVEVTFSYL